MQGDWSFLQRTLRSIATASNSALLIPASRVLAAICTLPPFLVPPHSYPDKKLPDVDLFPRRSHGHVARKYHSLALEPPPSRDGTPMDGQDKGRLSGSSGVRLAGIATFDRRSGAGTTDAEPHSSLKLPGTGRS
eukprot:3323318-Rhodomonas_salina.2